MSNNIRLLGDTLPHDIWKGHAAVLQRGVELAVTMLDELNGSGGDEDACAADFCCLEDWPRQARPFRNIVLEYLQRARVEGADVEVGFCAVLSDYVSLGELGSCSDADRYAHMFGVE